MLITELNYHKVVDFSEWSFSESTRIICFAIREALLESVSGLSIGELLPEYHIRVSLRQYFLELDLKAVVKVFVEELHPVLVNVSRFCGNFDELSFLSGIYSSVEDCFFTFPLFCRVNFSSSGEYLDIILNKEQLPFYLHCPCLETFIVPSYSSRCKIVFDKPVDFDFFYSSERDLEGVPGVYLLGTKDSFGKFKCSYVGYSLNLRNRLLSHNHRSDSSVTCFCVGLVSADVNLLYRHRLKEVLCEAEAFLIKTIHPSLNIKDREFESVIPLDFEVDFR